MAGSVRSDARRNREKLLEVATAAFAAAAGRPVSLESIARNAGVGSARSIAIPQPGGAGRGDLPGRARRSGRGRRAAATAASAQNCAAPLDGPLRGLRGRQAWDGRVATRDVRLRRHATQPDSRQHRRCCGLLLQAGARDGSLRADVQADDVVSSLIGIFLASGSPEQTSRLLVFWWLASPFRIDEGINRSARWWKYA